MVCQNRFLLLCLPTSLLSALQTLDDPRELQATVVRTKLVPYFGRVGESRAREGRFRPYHEKLSAETALPAQDTSVQHIRRNQAPFEFDSVEHKQKCLSC